MKRSAMLLAVAVALVTMSCATRGDRGPDRAMGARGHDLVARAVQASGGAETLAGVKMISTRGTVKMWEPEQSAVAGGEMRFANESTFETHTDTVTQASRIDWTRKFAYPAPRTFTFSEIVTRDAGYVAGIDSNGRTRQSLDSTPPQHNMSGLRLTATQREIRRVSPLLVLEMQRNPAVVVGARDITVGGATYPAVDYRVGDQTLIVMFDSATGLPARVRSLDYDNIWGDVTYDAVLSDWQAVDGVRIPMTRKYELNGRMVQEVKLSAVNVNGAVAGDLLQIPEGFVAGAPKAASGPVPFQWVLRRQFIGTYLDSDAPSWDTRASQGLRLNELAPGVQHVVGGSHHSLIVEMKDHLVVFDAPVSDAQTNTVLGLARAKFPGKPVKYLVLTHHHMDHAGGLRAYAAQGATIVTGKGTAAHFKKVLAAPFTRNPDLPSRDLSGTPVIEVADRHVLSDGSREVQAYVIDANPHAEGLMFGFVPHASLGFATDIWSPGAGQLPDKLNPALASLVAAVKKAGVTPAKFAGGHGSVADYAPLAALPAP
jgi:glyoxylase-like metal-dependent hydrolase (beta-lactamase superfamily II)